jgi:CheY-like chemotaxis protein
VAALPLEYGQLCSCFLDLYADLCVSKDKSAKVVMLESSDDISPPQPRCVLVVDDNDDGAWALATLLRLEGYDVRVAQNGEQAVELTERLHPTVVFMDLAMPRVDGFAAVSQIRRQAGGQQIFICAVTAYGSSESRRRAKEAGFDQYLVKPADIKELIRIARA